MKKHDFVLLILAVLAGTGQFIAAKLESPPTDSLGWAALALAVVANLASVLMAWMADTPRTAQLEEEDTWRRLPPDGREW